MTGCIGIWSCKRTDLVAVHARAAGRVQVFGLVALGDRGSRDAPPGAAGARVPVAGAPEGQVPGREDHRKRNRHRDGRPVEVVFRHGQLCGQDDAHLHAEPNDQNSAPAEMSKT